MAAVRDVTVAVAVRGELRDLDKRRPGSSRSGLGATALALARELDDQAVSATAKSMCAKSLQDILRQLHALTPAQATRGALDEIAAARRKRRGAVGAA